ncbi:MAG TPA: hypothetical protein VFE24_03315 [Pirellulales bacterium]|jgi:hypothetical protein|nr:hypothetical protein [Pirellulales bacterium]
MNLSPALVHLAVLTAMVAGGGFSYSAEPTAMELEQRAIHERQRIKQGDIHYHLDREVMQNVDGYIGTNFRIIFRPGLLRIDESSQGLNANGEPATEHICYVDGKPSIQFDDALVQDGQQTYINIGEKLLDDDMTANPRDPLAIGMFPGFPEVSVKINEYLTRTDRKDDTVTREQLGDREVFHLRWTRNNGSKFQFWISPSEGYSVVKAAVDFTVKRQRIGDMNDISVKQYGEGAAAVWYPEKIVFRRSVDGKLTPRETLTITEAVLNEPIDDKLFELASMKPNPGQQIYRDPPAKTEEIWDGEKIAPVQFSPAATGGKQGLSWGWLAVSIAAGVAAAVVFWRYYRAQRAA